LWHVVWHTENDGTNPVQEFLSSLGPEILTSFVASIDVVSSSSITGQTAAEYLERQLWELRQEKDTCRLIFSYAVGRHVVLLHGFRQQNRRATAPSEIELALQRLKNFLENFV
jgi:phage-related protein